MGRRPLFRSILGKPVSLILKRRTSSTWSSIASAPIRDIETLRVFLLAFFFPRQPRASANQSPKIAAELLVYSSCDVQVLEVLLSGGTVSRVQANGLKCFCKARPRGLFDENLEHELLILQKIEQSRPSTTRPIRIPRLLGLVKHADKGHIIGMLCEWIPSATRSLGDIDVRTTSKATREKWAMQIRQTVNQLHELGLVWGDAKPRNIVIGEDGNAWIVDFGGGWTNGWVDQELADTVGGDEQAVGKIMSLLRAEDPGDLSAGVEGYCDTTSTEGDVSRSFQY